MVKADPHPLGFATIDLIRLRGYRIRLHLWRRNAVINPGRHNHRWAFISVPLIGRFLDIRYDSVAGDEYQRLVCHPPDSDGARVMEQGGSGGLVERARHTRWPLVPYRCRLGEIHTFAPAGGGPHASLVFLGRARTDTSDVWPAGEQGSGT
jgi:hypothetical protein